MMIPGFAFMGSSELDQSLIGVLMRSVNLQIPDRYSMHSMGTISYRYNNNLRSCLLFKRDTASIGIVIFDIVRLATENMWQGRGYATKCVNVLIDILRHNFPNQTIILRVSALRNRSRFYENLGFIKGIIQGLSLGSFCGQPDCDTYYRVL